MTSTIVPQARISPHAAAELAAHLIPEAELAPGSVSAVAHLPSFADKMRESERVYGTPYSELAHEIQDALVLRRLQQMVNTVLLNPCGGTG